MQSRHPARRLSAVASGLAATKTTTIAAPTTTTAPPPPPSPTGKKIDPTGGNLFSPTVYAPPPPTAIPGDN